MEPKAHRHLGGVLFAVRDPVLSPRDDEGLTMNIKELENLICSTETLLEMTKPGRTPDLKDLLVVRQDVISALAYLTIQVERERHVQNV